MQRPERSEKVRQWQSSLLKDYGIRSYLSLAKDTRRQMESRNAVIKANWEASPMEVLNLNQYAVNRPSRCLLEQIARLREVIPLLEEGRQPPNQAMERRQISKKTPYTLTDTLLRPRDVKSAAEEGICGTKRNKTQGRGGLKKQVNLCDMGCQIIAHDPCSRG